MAFMSIPYQVSCKYDTVTHYYVLLALLQAIFSQEIYASLYAPSTNYLWFDVTKLLVLFWYEVLILVVLLKV